MSSLILLVSTNVTAADAEGGVNIEPNVEDTIFFHHTHGNNY